ncbi:MULTISPECIES: immunity 49 family protein [unclassified Streptomyces]|uniref:immunity 49 family protein n=1 Tax=unclassified Streptomyces TaxID=2593676 RepID=UPI002E181DA5|nr:MULTISPECIES: immunity 49 family protein [unclassified Streptomyces]
MVTSVPRHEFPVEATRADLPSLTKSTHRVLDRLERSDMSRSRALDATLTVAKASCASDPAAARFETWEAWVTAMQVGSALFAAGTSSDEPVSCRIGVDGKTKDLPATGPQPYLHVGAWLTSWYLATICRENERLEQLASVPVAFLRQSGAIFDEFLYDWAEALQSFWHGQSDAMWNKIVAAVNGTDPSLPHNADNDVLLNVLYPPLELFHLYQRQEVDRFNATLTRAVTGHKEYWTADEERARSVDGLVPLAPLALACMARDADFPIDVESDYLPKELLKFGWVGEVDA